MRIDEFNLFATLAILEYWIGVALSPETIEIYMKQALALAEEAASADEVPVGALLINDTGIIGRGRNRREETHRTAAHAEILALEDYSTRTEEWRTPLETSLVVTVEPCLMCVGALLWARVTNIYFGCKDSRNAGLLRISDLVSDGIYDHRFKIIQGGILTTTCSSLMSNYFRSKRE